LILMVDLVWLLPFLKLVVGDLWPIDLAVDGFHYNLTSKYIIQNGTVGSEWTDSDKAHVFDKFNPYLEFYLSLNFDSKQAFTYTLEASSRDPAIGYAVVVIGSDGQFSWDSRKHVQVDFLCSATGQFLSDFNLVVEDENQQTWTGSFVIKRNCEKIHPLPGFMVGAIITGDDDGDDPNVVFNGEPTPYFDGDFTDPRYQLISPEGDLDDTFTVWSTNATWPFTVYEVLFNKLMMNVTYTVRGEMAAAKGKRTYIDIKYECLAQADMSPVSVTLQAGSEGVTFTYLKSCGDLDDWYDPYFLSLSFAICMALVCFAYLFCWLKKRRQRGVATCTDGLVSYCVSCCNKTSDRLLPSENRGDDPDEYGQELVERRRHSSGAGAGKAKAESKKSNGNAVDAGGYGAL